MENVLDKIKYTEDGFIPNAEMDDKRKEELDEYVEKCVENIESPVIRRKAEDFLKAYTYGANDVLNAATTVFYNLFKAMLTVGLEDGTEEYAKMEEGAIRHTKDFYNMIIELSKIKAI